MKLDLGKTELKINFSFAAAVTVMLILDRNGFCAVALFCCVVHELGHILCLLIFGEKPKLIELSFYGIKLERAFLPCGGTKEIAVYASGPLANLLLSAFLFLLSSRFEGLYGAAVTSLCVGSFNLVPCRPLDGGNLIFAVLCRFTDEKTANSICVVVKIIIIVPMAFIGFSMLFGNGNFTLLAVAVYLVLADVFDKRLTN